MLFNAYFILWPANQSLTLWSLYLFSELRVVTEWALDYNRHIHVGNEPVPGRLFSPMLDKDGKWQLLFLATTMYIAGLTMVVKCCAGINSNSMTT